MAAVAAAAVAQGGFFLLIGLQSLSKNLICLINLTENKLNIFQIKL
jgi:hypothetical protein